MNIAEHILALSEKVRPVLVKLVPMPLLRRIKDDMVERSIKKNIRTWEREPYRADDYPEGINLIGCIRAEIGLGQSCRLVANELEHLDMPYSIKNFQLEGNLREEDHTYDHRIQEELPYGINLFHIEPLDLALAFGNTLDMSVWNGRYNIAFWLWELETFPESWKKALPLVDEIWTPSEFASESVRRVTDKPVYTIPYHVTAPVDVKYDRSFFGLPEDHFLFLIMYDTNSTMARKNPIGAIEAYKQAFSPDNDKVGLVIKMNNPKEEDIRKIRENFSGYDHIYYLTEIMEKQVVNSLLACVDVYVSLHRAEGFGLVMAEAMLNGTPCIATNWSSNTEFMNEDVACMVDYSFTTLRKPVAPYPRGARWAEANIDTAAGYMRRLVEDSSYYQMLAEKGQQYIREKLGLKQAIDKIHERVQTITGSDASIQTDRSS